jgi:hypothetical protein
MLVKLHTKHEEVDAALAALGLTRQVLLEAVLAGLLARDACTPNDPPFLPGIYQWGRTVRVLREVLAPLGWSRSDEGNFCTVVEPEGRFAIAVASGCEQTGVVGREMPTTKCRKGPNTADAVHANEQLYLFRELAPVVTREPDRATWILLFHNDAKEIRAELSLPNSIGEDGHINGWRDRIIIGSQLLDGDKAPAAPDFGPDPTIDVRRKA